MDVISYDTHTIDFDKLPPASQVALVSRGVTHFLGNEQASKVSAWAKKFAEEHGGTEPGDDEKAAKKAEFVAAAIKALNEGTVGSRVAGPRATPFDAALRAIAREEVTAALKNAKVKVPKGKETISYKGEDLTMDDLIARRIANPNHAERLQKEANAKVKESEKRLAKVAAEGELDI